MEKQIWKVLRRDGEAVILINELGDEIRISADFFNSVFKGDVEIEIRRLG